MPLNREQENLIYELYGVTRADDTVIESGDYGLAITPAPFWSNTSLKNRIAAAIVKINANPEQVARVATIVGQYSCMGLDPSSIERNGYKFNYNSSIAELKKRLYTYTGIVPAEGNANRITLG
jgi:hypothetical protein